MTNVREVPYILHSGDTVPDETAEHAYRRGYADGWVTLVSVLSDLDDASAAAFRLLALVAWHHWEGPLSQWVQHPETRLLEPPDIQLTPMTSTARARKKGPRS